MAARSFEFDGKGEICSVAFLAGGQQIVSGGWESKIRRWQTQDGKEAGAAVDAKRIIFNIAVSQDEKWIVAGTKDGRILVWNADGQDKPVEFAGHKANVCAVDVSPDGSKIVTGSGDETASVWSRSSGEQVLGPWKHNGSVAAAKFSPNGRFIATATLLVNSVRVYDSQSGDLLFDVQVQVGSWANQSLVWAIDSKRFFVLTMHGIIHCLDVLNGKTLAQWPIHLRDAFCIVLASNGTFVVASAGSSVSLWDTTTHEQIGSTVTMPIDRVDCMAISPNHELVIAGRKRIALRSLHDVLPSAYSERVAQAKREEEGRSVEETTNRTIAGLEKTIEQLRDKVSEVQRTADERDETNKSLREALQTQQTKSKNLEKTIEGLRSKLAEMQRAADEQNEINKSLRGALQTQEAKSGEMADLESLVEQLRDELTTADQEMDDFTIQLAKSDRKAESLARIIHAYEQKHRCEVLYAQGRVRDVIDALREMENTLSEEVRTNELLSEWLVDFSRRCATTLEQIGDEALDAQKPDEAVAAFSSVLLANPSSRDSVLTKWARATLARGSPQEVLSASAKFNVSKSLVCRIICDILEGDGRSAEAFEYFAQMQGQLSEEGASTDDEQTQWELNFRTRCVEKLEKLGDAARDSKKRDAAIKYYSQALSLNPSNANDILLKRSDEVIELDSSSYKGYEGKHAALHGLGRYKEAFQQFTMMLAKLEQSSDPRTSELFRQYVDVTPLIRKSVKEITDDMPRMLIDAETGCVYDKTKQREEFEKQPIFDELRSSMTTLAQLDYTRIKKEVKGFYRYVMLSHKWQRNEPTLQMIQKISVYKLPATLENNKIKQFCGLVKLSLYRWAWSDTCCVDQLDKRVLDEALTAMFKWYAGSSLTIVHLLGVLSDSEEVGLLWRSIWNTRGWTYQEYVASKVVQFYTEDWKPYLGLDIPNHKESPVILSEMEKATKFATKELVMLRPGFEKAREKLFLASNRQTERAEDIAYCLFGIFSVALPVMYGEGNKAVGRLLEHIVTNSDNVTLLAWTGTSGSQHSYLPVDLTVYNEIIPRHVPLPIDTSEMESKVAELRSSLLDVSRALALYNRLHDLPLLSMVAGRLRVPGIVFRLDDLVQEPDPESDELIYHGRTAMLGDVVIKTKHELSGIRRFLLIHPWIRSLVDLDFSYDEPLYDPTTLALRLIVRLQQRFGALLLAPSGTRGLYRRVATDSLIMVQVRRDTSLASLTEGIRAVDIQ